MENVSIVIDGQRFVSWSEVEITRSIDTFSTVSFKAPFEPERREFRDTFRPFSFKPIEIDVGDERLFTGVMVGVPASVDANARSVSVTGYALPGVIENCTEPESEVPYEFRKLSLKEIAEALAGPFGLGVDFRVDPGAVFKEAKLEEDGRIFAFLTELAKQRNIVLSNTPDGLLLCWQSVGTGSPIARLLGGLPPLVRVEPSFDPQQYFSQITGFASAKRGRKGGKWTESNPHLTGVLRPFNFKLDDTEPADGPEATRAKLGRMFGQVSSWSISDIPTWRTPGGALWSDNTTVLVQADDAMIYRESELLVRSVSLKQTATAESATLDVVLPGAYSGDVPEFLPWDEPT